MGRAAELARLHHREAIVAAPELYFEGNDRAASMRDLADRLLDELARWIDLAARRAGIERPQRPKLVVIEGGKG